MTSRTSFGLGFPLLSLFIAASGCLELGTATSEGSGGHDESTTSSSSSSSSGKGGGGQGGASLTSSASSSASSASSSSSSSSGGSNTVWCNDAPCQPSEVCCFSNKQPGTSHCAAGTCGPGFITISCNGPEDCPGKICCGSRVNTIDYTDISCQDSCNGADQNVMCTDKPGVCPGGTSCKQSMILGQGYMLCY